MHFYLKNTLDLLNLLFFYQSLSIHVEIVLHLGMLCSRIVHAFVSVNVLVLCLECFEVETINIVPQL